MNTLFKLSTKLSSVQNFAQSAIAAINSALTDVNTAKSRIVDADYASETSKLSKNQILQQAGTAMLAQANQLPSIVLSLLK
jgi:flagellin